MQFEVQNSWMAYINDLGKTQRNTVKFICWANKDFQLKHAHCVVYKLKYYIKYINNSHTQLYILLDYIRL